MHTERVTPQVIVGAAIIDRGRVLACARADPPGRYGRWEFPGGKLEPGESEPQALVRECEEELGVRIHVGTRVGGDIPVATGWGVLKVYLARLLDGQPQALEHEELRWLGPDELHTVDWLPADAPVVDALRPLLGGTMATWI